MPDNKAYTLGPIASGECLAGYAIHFFLLENLRFFQSQISGVFFGRSFFEIAHVPVHSVWECRGVAKAFGYEFDALNPYNQKTVAEAMCLLCHGCGNLSLFLK